MPEAWSEKDERQYRHIRDSEEQRGRTADRAKEIAARTVNRQRREEGRTPSRRTSGTGSRNARLDARTVEELRNRAAELGIRGRSGMNKRQLIAAIREEE